ncbi:MAG: hypothetical protein ACJAR1_002816 [Rubritalea sp.]|jgi:hypothetical protein
MGWHLLDLNHFHRYDKDQMLSDSHSSALEPPRLLAGVTLLYWGAMTGEAFIALIIAVLLEGKNWVKWRWDFDAMSYVKAFQLSLGLLGLVLFLVWLDEVNHNSLFQVMKWFPLCFLPVELSQRYGKNDKMNLNTFFYFSRQRMRQDLKEGRSINPKKINTGYPYLFGVLVVASCTSKMNIYVHITMLILMTIVILSVSIKRGLGWKRLIWALPMTLLVSVWMQSETAAIYKSYAANGSAHKDPDLGESNPHRSTLGQLGKMKLNSEIQWRMWGDDVPEYLRLNSYNKHHGVLWSYYYKSPADDINTMEDAFDSRIGIELGSEGSGLFVFNAEHEAIMERSGSAPKMIKLRGKGQSDTIESIVPAAEGLVAVSEMAGEDVKAAVHPLGVLKLINRKAIIDYQLWSTDQNLLDSEPENTLDLAIHKSCKKAVALLSDEMQLSSYESSADKVNAIRDFFMQEFTYALHFDVPKTDFQGSDIERFMLTDRRGHCEYFATTAALLLRQQGIPTRYCVGYVVREKNADTWIIRGSHAHAWCSAWIGGKWVIVDLTPPDWLSLESEKNGVSWAQDFKDWFQNIKQDFLIWRSNEENKSLMNLVMWVLGVIPLLWFSYKLFKVRVKQVDSENLSGSVSSFTVPEEFEIIENKLSLVIGSRPVAQTYHSWVNSASSKVDEKLFVRLVDLVTLHEQSRFGGVDKAQEITRLSQEIKSLLN